jgi:hypothetical protein
MCDDSAMDDQDLTLPLWRYPLRWLSGWLTFHTMTDRWSYLAAGQREQRRASWSRWRRSVRPVGLCVFWAGVLWSVFGNEQTTTTTVVIRAGWIAAMLPFAVIGVRDWMRDGRAEHARRALESSSEQ